MSAGSIRPWPDIDILAANHETVRMKTGLWNQLTQIGAELDCGEMERRRLYLLQYSNLLAVVSMLGIAAFYLFADARALVLPIIASLACIPLYGLSWLLNRQGHGLAAKLTFMSVLTGSIFLATWFLIGRDPGMHFYFLLAAIMPLFLWPLGKLAWIGLFMGLNLLGFVLIQNRPDDPSFLVASFPRAWLGFFNGMAVVATYATTVALLAALHRRSEKDASLREGLLRQFEELSNTDSLTGLYNRRSMMRTMEEERARMNRNHQDFALLLGDIDFFKTINDTHGHEAGDAVLAGLGTLFKGALREVDTVARWGGEEFLILLPDTGPEGAIKVAQKLCSLVAGSGFAWGGQELKCTMTWGVAVHKLESPGFEDTIRKADEALYRGKNGGRNQAVSA